MTTPIVSRRAPVYADVPDEKWNDWRWQLSNRLNTAEDFEQGPSADRFRAQGAARRSGLFRVDITPYFISLIDPNDPDDPVRKQIIPTDAEMMLVHRHDGGLAGRGPPLARCRAWCTATPTAC